MSAENEKIFLEFTIDGVIRVPIGEKDPAIKELTKLLSKVMHSRDLIKLDTNITALSERDIMFAMYAQNPYDDN